jgi:hypothetical protein
MTKMRRYLSLMWSIWSGESLDASARFGARMEGSLDDAAPYASRRRHWC